MTALLLGALLAATPPTYADDVAEILNSKCVTCHRPGQSGPFPLLSFADASEHAGTIADVIEADYMPPWPPSPEGLPLRHDRSLSDAQKQTLRDWAAAGGPAGDLKTAPTPPKFSGDWSMGEPDVVLEMSEAFPVPEDGRDIYRWFSLPVNADGPLHVRAFEFRPSSDGAVHHSLLYVDSSRTGRKRTAKDGLPGFRGMRTSPDMMLGGFVPGMVPSEWPDGLSVTVPAGADLVLQTHFHPTGKADLEQSKVGLYLAEGPPPRTLRTIQLPPMFGAAGAVNIPAGDADWRMADEFTVPSDVTAYGVSGHAHYLCRWMRLTVTRPGEEPVTALAINDWDLNWQGDYKLAEPMKLPAGTLVRAELSYDNSAENPSNPYSPPKRVKWGEESNDEMGSLDLVVTADTPEGDAALKRAITFNRLKIIKPSREPRPTGPVNPLVFAAMDRDGSGGLSVDEVPKKFARLHRLLDEDADGSVTAEEMQPMAWLLKF